MNAPAPALEERLTAALAARAGQVTAADLEPAGVPGPPRRKVPVLLAATAAVALVVGSLALWRPGGGSAPDPVAPTPSVATELVVPAASQFTSEPERADAAPPVGSLTALLRPDIPALEMATDDGFSYTIDLPGPATHLGRTGILAPDGSAAFLVGTSDGRSTTVTSVVGRYRDRRGEVVYSVLALGDAPGAPPLADGRVRLGGGPERPARDVIVRTWVAPRGSAYTLVLPEGTTSLRRAAGPVEVWRWDIDGRSLRPTRLAGLCLDGRTIARC